MNEAVIPAVQERWIYTALAALIVVRWLATLAARPLLNPDRGDLRKFRARC